MIFLFMFINIVSLLITSLYPNEFPISKLNNYLNPFNWIGFFGMGYLMKNRMAPYLLLFNRYYIFIILVYLGFLMLSVSIDSGFGYFSLLAFPNEILGMVVIFSIATLPIFRLKKIIAISDYVFTVYLLHFLVFPLRIFLIQNHFTQFINPIIYIC
jgi:hypothetical protein